MTDQPSAWPKVIGALLLPALLALTPTVRGEEATKLASSASVTIDPPKVESAPTCRYFASVFGAQSTPKRAKYTHTFGFVVKATGFGSDLRAYDLELHAISWMPATLDIKVLKFIPETGTDLDLYDTLDWALSTDQSIAQWGPYEIPERGYGRALDRIAELQSGAVKYQCIDPLIFRVERISDCIHAISDLDPSAGRFRYPLLRFGKAASRHIVRRVHSAGVFIDPYTDHSWLNARLGLDHYPISRQPLPKLGLLGRVRRSRLLNRRVERPAWWR